MQVYNSATVGTTITPQPRADQKANLPGVPIKPQPEGGVPQQAQPTAKTDAPKDPIEIPSGDKAREEFIQKAAELFRSRTFYPISDTRFTIYKDGLTGEFITRFTNMKDGSVTHIPEPEIAAFYYKMRGEGQPIVRTEA